MMWLANGCTPNARHDSNTGTVTITSSVSITNDTAWRTIVTTWRKNRLELYLDGISRANSTAANTNTSASFGIYRWGWGFSTSGLQRRHRLVVCCFVTWTQATWSGGGARPVRLPAPLGRGACAHVNAPPPPPATGTGVVLPHGAIGLQLAIADQARR